MDENRITRSARIRQPPRLYTPTHQGKPKDMPYKLNAKKAIEKKLDAVERNVPIEIEMKRGTLVITCNAGAYETLKTAIYKYYDTSDNKTYRLFTKASKANMPNMSTQPMIVEESLSIKPKNGDTKKQLYRINLFNTKSKIDANGHMLHVFMNEDLTQILATLKNDNTFMEINARIKDICESMHEIFGTMENVRNQDEKKHQTVRASYINQNNIDTPDTHIDEGILQQNQITAITTHMPVNQLQGEENSTNTRGQISSIMTNTVVDNLDRQIESIRELADQDMNRYSREEEIDTSYRHHCGLCGISIGKSTAAECASCGQWFHTKCTDADNLIRIHDQQDSMVCSSCNTLDRTIPFNDTSFDETEVKQILSRNKEPNPKTLPGPSNKNIPQKIQEEALKQQFIAGNPTTTTITTDIYDDKSKQKKVKKKATNEAMEIQIATCIAKITNLEETNKDYRNTIDLLSAKLGIPTASTNNTTETCQLALLEAKMEHKIESLKAEFEHRLQTMDLQMRHAAEVAELKSKIKSMENENNTNSRPMQQEQKIPYSNSQHQHGPPQFNLPYGANIDQSMRTHPQYRCPPMFQQQNPRQQFQPMIYPYRTLGPQPPYHHQMYAPVYHQQATGAQLNLKTQQENGTYNPRCNIQQNEKPQEAQNLQQNTLQRKSQRTTRKLPPRLNNHQPRKEHNTEIKMSQNKSLQDNTQENLYVKDPNTTTPKENHFLGQGQASRERWKSSTPVSQ